MNVFFGIFSPKGSYNKKDSEKMHEIFSDSAYKKSAQYFSNSFTVSEYVSSGKGTKAVSHPCFYESTDWVVAGYLSLTYRGELLDKLGFYETADALKSDAELVFHAFLKWGEKCTVHIEGEWCFLVYDKQGNSLKIFKDFSGVSSCYYFLKEGALYFSSFSSVISQSLRAYLVPDFENILRITSLKFVPNGGSTVFQNMKSLVPGQVLYYSHQESLFHYSCFPTEFDKCISYKFLEDYIEDFNQLFYDSVREITAKGKNTALFLSGGKDSASVGYYMSQEAKYNGKYYQAYTSVPAYKVKKNYTVDKIYDETEFVEEMIRDYPNFKIHVMNFKSESIVSAFQDRFDLNSFFPVVTKNSYWLRGILNEGKNSGADTFVTAQMGNFTITSNGFYYYADMLKRFCVLEVAASYINENKKWNVGLLYFIKHYLLIPLKQLWILHYRVLIAEHRKFEYSFMEKNIRKTHGKITFKNYLNIFRNFFKRNSNLRLELLKINLEFCGNVWSHLAASNGVKIFDPTADFRLINFLYGIPQSLFFQNKTGKFLFRSLMKGRVPSKILKNDRYQNQSFDFPLKFVSDKAFSHFFESAMKTPGEESSLLDLDRIRKAYEDAKQDNTENYTGVNINMFLNNFSVYLFLKSEN